MLSIYVNNSGFCVRTIVSVIFMSAMLFIGTATVHGQQTTDDRAAKCRAFSRKNNEKTNEMLDIERKQQIEGKGFQLKGQLVVLSTMEADLKKVQSGRITPEMQKDRDITASELELKWDDRWNLDYVSYYKAIIAAEKEFIKKMEAEIGELKTAMRKEPDISGFDNLDLRHKAIKKEMQGIAAEMENLKCIEILEADRIKYEWETKGAEEKKEREEFLANLTAIEAQVNAATAKGNQLKGLVSLAVQLSVESRNAVALAGELLNLFRRENTQLALNAAKNRCGLPQKLTYDGEQALIEARQKKDLIYGAISDASGMAGRCTSKEQADVIQDKYRTAVQWEKEIGAFDQAAATRLANLVRARQDVLDAKPVFTEAQAVVDRITAQKKLVQRNRGTVNSSIYGAPMIADEIRVEGKVILGEYNQLRQDYLKLFPSAKNGDWTRGRVMILNDRIEALLATSVPPDLSKYYADIEARENEIDIIRQQADNTWKQYEGALCDVKIFDDAIAKAVKAVQDIAGILRETSLEIVVVSDLPQKAKACVKSVECQAMRGDLRAAITANDTGGAEALIVRMNGAGCDTSDLKAELAAKNERDAVNLIDQSKQNCRFQQAVDLAAQIPESIGSKPRVAAAISEAQAGLKAQQRIEDLIDKADQTSDIKAATSYIAQARTIAAPYPCLANMLKGSGPRAAEPAVEEIPADREADNRSSAKTKPDTGEPAKVEELPEDRDVRPVATKEGTSKPPVVESIPDGDDPKPVNDRTTSKNTDGKETPVTVAEIPEDDNPQAKPNKQAVADGKQAVTNAKQPKPKKTGPGFWEKLGKAAEIIGNEIGKTNTSQPPGDSSGGNPSPPVTYPPVTPPQTGQGTTNSCDYDFSGTWMVQLVIEGTGADRAGNTLRWQVSSLGNCNWSIDQSVVNGNESVEKLTGKTVLEGGGRIRIVIPGYPDMTGTFAQSTFSVSNVVDNLTFLYSGTKQRALMSGSFGRGHRSIGR